MGKIRYIIALAVMSFLFLNKEALSWDNNKTHKDISKIAAEKSVLGTETGNYLSALGLNNGLLEKFTWNGTQKYATEWLQEGAKVEDDNWRPLNHFHNPLKPWSSAGLGLWESAVVWAQDSSRQASWPYGPSGPPSNECQPLICIQYPCLPLYPIGQG